MSKTDVEPRRVVLVNGPAGVGKTTVGRAMAATVRNGICIHGDDLKHFVVSRKPGTVEGGLTYVGGASLADLFLDAGYELIVFEFVFPGRRHVARFRDALRASVPVHLLTLWAPLATVTRREAGRQNRERLGGRMAECWHELAAGLDELGAVIDASPPVDEVVRAAREVIRDGRALLTDRRLTA
jgi:chloramphenicol 3-O-phosphotransferase